MEETTQQLETLEQRRTRLFAEWDEEYPPVNGDFIVTNSGIVEQIPEDPEDRDRFFVTNTKFGGV